MKELRNDHQAYFPLPRDLFFIISLAAAPIAEAQQDRILVPADEKTRQTAAPTGARAQKPQLVLQTGLTEPPTKVAFSADGALLAAMGMMGGAVRLWDVATGRELLALKTRDGSLGYMQSGGDFIFNPDGRTLTTFAGGTVRLWETATGAVKREAVLFDGREYGWSQFSPDGRLLATYGAETRELRIWDVAAGALVKTHGYRIETSQGDGKFANLNAVSFSPDSRLIAISEDEQEMTSRGAEVTIREVASWKPVQTLTLQPAVSAKDQQKALAKNSRDMLEAMRKGNASVTGTTAMEQTTALFSRAVKFTPDGRTLAVLKRDLLQRFSMQGGDATYNQAVAVELYDVASGRTGGSFAVSPATDKTNPRDFWGQLAHSISFNGRQCLVAENNANARLVDVNDGRTLATLAGAGEVIAVAFNADGRRAAVSEIDGTIRVWNLANAASGRAETLATFSSPALGVGDVKFSADGKSLVVASSNTVSTWELGAGTATRTLSIAKAKPKSAADFQEYYSASNLSGDGSLYLTRGKDGLKVFDARTGAERRSLPIKLRTTYGNKIALSRDGGRMAFATGYDPAAFYRQSAAAPNAQSSQAGVGQAGGSQDPNASGAGANPKDDKDKKSRFPGIGDLGGFGGIARPGRSKDQKQPDTKEVTRISKEMQKKMEEYQKAMQSGETAKANQIMEEVQALTARMMAASGQGDMQLPTMTGQSSNQSSQSSQTGAMGRMYQIPREEIKVLDLTNGRELATIGGRGMMEMMAQSMAISPDGRWVATAFSASKISLADAQTGKEALSLTVDRGFINQGMVFSPDGKYLASLNSETRPGVNQMETNLSMSQRYLNTLRVWDVSDPAKGARALQAITVAEQFPTIAFSADGRI
ncbi:MAG: WD40 repeat domain-containing protein, partial [Blastocatellia bacterium]